MATPRNANIGGVAALFNALIDDNRDGIKALLTASFELDVAPANAGPYAGNYDTEEQIFKLIDQFASEERHSIDTRQPIDIRLPREDEVEEHAADVVATFGVCTQDGEYSATVYFKVAEGRISYAQVVIGNQD